MGAGGRRSSKAGGDAGREKREGWDGEGGRERGRRGGKGGEGVGAVRSRKTIVRSTRSETPDEKERRWNLNGNDGRETD